MKVSTRFLELCFTQMHSFLARSIPTSTDTASTERDCFPLPVTTNSGKNMLNGKLFHTKDLQMIMVISVFSLNDMGSLNKNLEKQ